MVEVLFLILLFLFAYAAIQFGRLKKLRPHDSTKRILLALWKRICFFLPTFYPLLFGALLYDLDTPLPILIGALLLFLFLMPYLMIKTWGCKPLRQEPLKEDLEALCKKLSFSCNGILSWELPHMAPTAAVVGYLPPFRFILITERMLASFTNEMILAVMAHEIGHSKKHHLLFLPFLLLGMLSPLLFFNIESVYEIALFTLWALLFYRFVFGFFSRLFEKEADLFGAKQAGGADVMISALKQVSSYSSKGLHAFSWHHGSLQERIDLLERIKGDPLYENLFLRRVHFFQLFYIIILIALGVLWWI